uniref:Zgc:152948 n=1 Tax=Cyprinus carpio TaxID=7962 RepID=A0A8C1SS36_CYPCA
MSFQRLMMSPESSVTSGLLQSSLHPEPGPSIKYRDKHYASASEALDAYITDFQRSLRGSETTTGKLELLTDEDVTTDDLLALPNDVSIPVTRTSALLSRSGSLPLGLSFNSTYSRPIVAHKHSMRHHVTPASRRSLPADHLHLRQAPPPNILPTNWTHPPDTPRSSHLPRWMTSQKSEMDFSGMTSQRDVKGHAGELYGSRSIAQSSPRELRSQSEQKHKAVKRGQIHQGQLFKDDKIGSLIFRAEQALHSSSFALCEPVKERNSSGDTEDALDADRSWDNPPVMFKSPVPVGGAEEPPASEEHQRSKSAASCSSGYSSRKQPGPVEALKHMLIRLQAVEHKISQSHATTQETEESDLGNVESLQRALHHLDRLKTLVDDMNERKARAEDDGMDYTDTPAANTTDWTRIKKQL